MHSDKQGLFRGKTRALPRQNKGPSAARVESMIRNYHSFMLSTVGPYLFEFIGDTKQLALWCFQQGDSIDKLNIESDVCGKLVTICQSPLFAQFHRECNPVIFLTLKIGF